MREIGLPLPFIDLVFLGGLAAKKHETLTFSAPVAPKT